MLALGLNLGLQRMFAGLLSESSTECLVAALADKRQTDVERIYLFHTVIIRIPKRYQAFQRNPDTERLHKLCKVTLN